MEIQEAIQKKGYYIIAEIGVNYYDIADKYGVSLVDAARIMVSEAKNAGADAVKFQTYKASTLAAKESPYYWDFDAVPVKTQYELFKNYEAMKEADYQQIKAWCDQIGITFSSTPFDIDSADYLYDLMPFYKISSSDLNNLPFVEYMSKKGKPIILSVGASGIDEIRQTVDCIRKHNQQQLTLLHCVLEYPTPDQDANLRRIQSLKKEFPDVIVGYSDHTKPLNHMRVLKTAYILGAQVIEKHFTIDKTITGKNDHFHSMDPSDLRELIIGLKELNTIMGNGELTILESEMTARKNARRSLVSTRLIRAGETITEDMLTFKRPGTGISPTEQQKLLLMRAKDDIAEDTTLQWAMFE